MARPQLLFADALAWTRRQRLLREPTYDIALGSQRVDELMRLLPMRLPFNRPLLVVGDGNDSHSRALFKPGERDAVVEADDKLVVQLTPTTAGELAETPRSQAGNYAVAGLPITFAVKQPVIAA